MNHNPNLIPLFNFVIYIMEVNAIPHKQVQCTYQGLADCIELEIICFLLKIAFFSFWFTSFFTYNYRIIIKLPCGVQFIRTSSFYDLKLQTENLTALCKRWVLCLSLYTCLNVIYSKRTPVALICRVRTEIYIYLSNWYSI